jgi:hypothetical protein
MTLVIVAIERESLMAVKPTRFNFASLCGASNLNHCHLALED